MTNLDPNTQLNDPPAWLEELTLACKYAHHVIVSGNIRDIFPNLEANTINFVNLTKVIQKQMLHQGVAGSLIYDPVTGIHKGHGLEGALSSFERQFSDISFNGASSLDDLARAHSAVLQFKEHNIGIIVDYASHLNQSSPKVIDKFFIQIDKASKSASTEILRNRPMVWLVDRPSDLPEWFVIRNDVVREVHVDLPNLEDRYLFSKHSEILKSTYTGTSQEERLPALQQFAIECDGETLITMEMIANVARDEGITLDRITDAIRILRTGLRRNPWRSNVLSERVRQARQILTHRIKGQDRAIEKTMDILTRSIIGLSGAQSSARHLRPRGVLFLAGPTGVGKTEMAKAITELLFGDESVAHRFDMSEFMEEDSVARLIGAPPGHPGHERGGELVNAAHQRPFSVFLFDEIEKAHPRILDIFLQIIDEGRLTDARGSIAHFSEALIIFTSNIGVTKGSRVANLGMNVLPSDSHEELEEKILASIQDYFRVQLRRPELLNRIGQNIVVFDFLSNEAAVLIFDAIVKRILNAVYEERKIHISLSPSSREQLMSLCLVDFFEGGRGIGNRIENHLVNPLAREIFEKNLSQDCEITSIRHSENATHLEIIEIKQ